MRIAEATLQSTGVPTPGAMEILPIDTATVTSVPNDGLNTAIEALQQSLQQMGGAPALPSFGGQDFDPEKMEPWKQWIRDVWDWLLKRFAPEFDQPENAINFFKYLGYALILVVIILLCWAAYRWLKRQELPQYGRLRAPRRMSEDSRQYLETALGLALAQKSYALAARLRWRLYLLRTGRPAGRTQAELLGTTQSDVVVGPAVSNALMFSEVAEADGLTRAWDQQLSAAESQPHPTKVPNGESGAAREVVLLLGLALGIVGILVFNLFFENRKHQERSVAEGNGPYQIRPLIENRPADLTKNLDMPILDREDLGPSTVDGDSILLMLSPRMSLSRRETNILDEKITGGLHLVLSFHDQTSMEAVKKTLLMINSSFVQAFEKNESFENQKTEIIESPVDMAWLRKGERYAFYAPLTMQDMRCDLERIFCFIREFEMGRGNITVVAGLFPASSALALQADNQLLAARMIQDPRPMLVDQYHLLQSDRGISELMTEAFFWIPLLIMIVGLIVYMIWGQETTTSRGFGLLRADRANYLKRRPHQPDSYHQFSRRMLQQALKRPAAAAEAAQIQGQWLAQLMAARAGTAPEALRLSAIELTQKHIEWLKHNFLWKVSRKETSDDHSPSL